MSHSTEEIRSIIPPSPWVLRHCPAIPAAGEVLDLACGSGRHARLLAARQHPVLAVDRDFGAISGLQGVPGITALQLDLEGDVWPLAGRCFAGIVVTNYLWRLRLGELPAMLLPGGVLIYETFMIGNEAYGKPANPDFLLRPDELRDFARAAGLVEIAYEAGYAAEPKPMMRQAIVARKPT